ncbi:uncharacterized protein LOC135087380 [Ostrinia nubilalis]|uniref:uncharacterized protein LOC135087380 n=1 Tax=Ostrinia nubilalis TaxID=29057 RepID=UPI003082353A
MWKDKMKDTEVSRPEELPSTSKGTYIEVAAKQVLNAPLLEELPSTSECTTVEVAERQIFNEQKSNESNKKPDVTNGRAKGVKRKLDESMDLSPRKRKLVKQLVRTKCTLKSLAQFL